MTAGLSDYLARLRAELDGKTPRRLKRPLLGDIVFVLTDASGGKHRFTVSLEEQGARVTSGVHEQEGRASALIRGSLEAWLAYFHDGRIDRMDELGFHGEVALLETLAGLLTLKMSPLAMRVGTKRPRDD